MVRGLFEGRGDLDKTRARNRKTATLCQRAFMPLSGACIPRAEEVLGTGPSVATVIDHVTTTSSFYSRFLVDRSL